jgi:hypothetical protein
MSTWRIGVCVVAGAIAGAVAEAVAGVGVVRVIAGPRTGCPAYDVGQPR